MRDGWRETTLGELAEIIMGQAPDGATYNTDGVGLPFIQGSAEFGRRVPSPKKWCSAPRKVAEPGDILVSVRAPVGDLNWADTQIAIGRGLGIIRAGALAYPAFLAVSIESATEALAQRSSSGMFASINRAGLSSIPITLPPLDEQRRIVDLIAAVDDAVDAAEAEATAARELSDAARRVLFENAEGQRERLGEVVTFAGGYAFPPSEQGRTEGDVPFIKVSDMNLPGNERGIRSAVNWVTTDVKAQLRAKAWPEGTVVFPKVGAALLTEKRRFLTRPTIFDNNVMGLVAGSRLDSAYLLAFMEGVRLSELAQHGAVPSVNQSHLTSMEIPVPPLSEQHLVVRQYEAVLDAADTARATADALRALRSNLLTVLLSGEHEIPPSYDALLEEVA